MSVAVSKTFNKTNILFYSIIVYSILFYSILFYFTLFYAVLLCSIMLYSILPILFYSTLLYSILFYSMHAFIIIIITYAIMHSYCGKCSREMSQREMVGGCLFINLLVEISGSGGCPDVFDQMSQNVPPKVCQVLFGITERPGMNFLQLNK